MGGGLCMIKNPVIDSLINHKSIRRFIDKEISKEIIEGILNAGTRAATGGNLQCYSFILIDDQDTKEKLNKYDKYHDLLKIPLIIIALVDTYRLKRWFEVNSSQLPYVNEPLGFFIANWDALIALHNVSIAAESVGLGTFYNGNVLEYDIYEVLNAPEYTFPAGMLCVGYPDQNVKLSLRLPLEAIVHKNEYRRFTDDEIKNFYAEREKIWESVPQKKKEELKQENIFNIPQAVAKQKFNKEFTSFKSRRIYNILEKSGFNFKEYFKG